MKKPKLNFRKRCRLSPLGIETKVMMGSKRKFHIVNTTQALVITASRMDDPITASVVDRLFIPREIDSHDPNSKKARNVSRIQLHPVKEMGNAAMLCRVTFA
mmetsp:Transcript_2388/g.5510  ORF Transcript_2388/g.5510 Transcript_2388/m.5510 type:complete len:102 (-) Transcript_2388:370-675(-)